MRQEQHDARPTVQAHEGHDVPSSLMNISVNVLLNVVTPFFFTSLASSDSAGAASATAFLPLPLPLPLLSPALD